MSDPTSRPAIAKKRDNMDEYDTIFVEFPIWWYIAPTIVNAFLESYDLTGKTIIPFATSGGSGMGKTNEALKPMREWLGTSEVDLSVFDLQDLNFRLKKLPRIFRDLYEYDYPPTKHSIDLLDRKYCKTN